MKRDISFRVYNPHSKPPKFIEGNVSYSQRGKRLNLHEEPYIFQQNTSLRDINGVEIYEGDVIDFDNQRWEVEYGQGAWHILRRGENDMTYLLPLWPACAKMRVIGNIVRDSWMLNPLNKNID